MLILKKLTLINFLSHSNTVLEFKEGQKLLIDGVSGSGKSSIPEAIVWCLYGKGRTDHNISLIKKGTKETIVSLELIDDGEDGTIYLIERKVNDKNKRSLSVQTKSNKDKKFNPVKVKGTKEVQEYLEDKILHSSYLLFINSIIYPQDNTENFVRQTASKRKDLLLEIISATTYDDYFKKARDAIVKTKTILEVSEARNNDYGLVLENEKRNTKNLTEKKKEKSNLEKEIKIFETEYKNLNAKIEEINDQKNLVKIDKESLLSTESQISSNEIKIKAINDRISGLQEVDIEKIKEKVKELEEVKKTLKGLEDLRNAHSKWQENINIIKSQAPPSNTTYEYDIGHINKQIVEIMTKDIENCPELNKPCPTIEANYAKESEKLKKRLEELNNLQKELENKFKDHLAKLDAVGPAPVYSQISLANVQTKVSELEHFEKELIGAESVQSRIKEIEDDSRAISKDQVALIRKTVELKEKIKNIRVDEDRVILEKFASMSMEKEQLSMKKTNLTVSIELGENSVKKVNEYKEKIKKTSEEIDEVKGDIDALKLIKEAFGPIGIKTMVIDYVLPQLEDKINDILSKLSDFRIRLDTQKSGVGKDTVIEGLFINIINDMGEEYDFNNYSGGERLKIIVAISEALAEIQKVGFRVLDELFIGLDQDSTEDFTNVMEELQGRFSQILCISHLRTIKDIFNEKITIVKTNGNSKIVE